MKNHKIFAALCLGIIAGIYPATQAFASTEQITVSAAASPEKIAQLKEKAGEGDANAQFNLGLIYYEGKAVEQDYQLAVQWFRKAALQAQPQAQYYLGRLYERGEGLNKDPQRAKEWFSHSCTHGDQKGCEAYKRLNPEG